MNSTNIEHILDTFRKRRYELRLSQEAVAGRAYMSQNCYNKIENGKTRLHLEVFVRLARALDLNPAELII
jgi:transcriptional regulator with XRE-family HTH domain